MKLSEQLRARRMSYERDGELLALAADALEKQEWVSVEDRLPEHSVLVIVRGGVAYYDKNTNLWMTVTGFIYPGSEIVWKVTHWKPIEPPEDV